MRTNISECQWSWFHCVVAMVIKFKSYGLLESLLLLRDCTFLNAARHLRPSILSVLTEPDSFLIYKNCFCITNEAIINCDFFSCGGNCLQRFSLTAAKMNSACCHSGFCYSMPALHFRLASALFCLCVPPVEEGVGWGGGGVMSLSRQCHVDLVTTFSSTVPLSQ